MSHCGLPDGQTSDLFGPVAARASHLAPLAKARRPMTSATCGLNGFLSSESADLQQSLVSKLMRRLDGVGSTLFSLTWRRKATPAGRPYYQLVASARRTSETEFGSWPSPSASFDGSEQKNWKERRKLIKDKGINGNGFGLTLPMAASLIGWPTPTVHDSERGGQAKRAAGDTRHGSNLQDFAMLASNGFHARTGKRGQLNPAFSLWLMGFPPEWESYAPLATRSSRKLRPNSSEVSYVDRR
jgi:hypothetical protein